LNDRQKTEKAEGYVVGTGIHDIKSKTDGDYYTRIMDCYICGYLV
jgi:uncharacterized Fe-S cluster-containing MiaB family protein